MHKAIYQGNGANSLVHVLGTSYSDNHIQASNYLINSWILFCGSHFKPMDPLNIPYFHFRWVLNLLQLHTSAIAAILCSS